MSRAVKLEIGGRWAPSPMKCSSASLLSTRPPLAIFSRIITGTVEWPEEENRFSQEALTFVESLLNHNVEERLGTIAGADE